MPRTLEQFTNALRHVERLAKYHKTPYWLVPTCDGYSINIEKIPPNADDLPFGTAANLYDTNLDVIATVVSSKTIGF